jgi:hypothetical protein
VTCIVGLVDDGGVWFGGDSMTAAGWEATIMRGPKIFQHGPLLMGTTGTCRIAQLLEWRLAVPPLPTDTNWYRWVATDLTDAIRTCLKDGGHAKQDNGQEAAGGNAILIGVAGHLFELADDYGLVEAACGYDAIGCGQAYARGALFASAESGLPPARRIQQALEAAEAFSAGVRGPFTVLRLEAPGA